MALDRTNITVVDDDGTQTTGTVLDAAFFDAVYDAIDAYAALLGPSEDIPFFAVAGPTALRTFTFPDADAEVFTSVETFFPLGGLTSSFPAIKRVGTEMQVVLADDSGFTVINASQLKVNSTTFLVSAVGLGDGAAAGAGTLTNAPAAGNPTKWIPINDNGTTRYLPAW